MPKVSARRRKQLRENNRQWYARNKEHILNSRKELYALKKDTLKAAVADYYTRLKNGHKKAVQQLVRGGKTQYPVRYVAISLGISLNRFYSLCKKKVIPPHTLDTQAKRYTPSQFRLIKSYFSARRVGGQREIDALREMHSKWRPR